MRHPRALIGLSAAVLVAPAVVGLATAITIFAPGPNFPLQLGNWMIVSMIVGVPIALFHVFIVATPAYSILERRWPLHWWSAALGGLLTGTMPTALIGLVVVAVQAASGSVAIMAMLQMILWLLAWFAVAGMAGGLSFWLFVRKDVPA